MEREDHPTGTTPPYPYPPQYGYRPPPAAPPEPPEPPEPEKPKWSTRKTTAVTAVAAAAVLGIGGVAVASSGGDSGSSAAQGPGGQAGGPGRGAFPGGGAVLGSGLAGALHGTFVTGSGGSYVTRVMQAGEVTAASSTALTVKSTDGYTKSYTLSGSTSVNGGQSDPSAIATGHTVTVIATESGAALSVVDQSLAGTGGGPGFPGGTGQDGTGQGSGTTA
jgi:hypothetical protein